MDTGGKCGTSRRLVLRAKLFQERRRAHACRRPRKSNCSLGTSAGVLCFYTIFFIDPAWPSVRISCLQNFFLLVIVLAFEMCGTVVQLVRALPCHGRSCGFESRPSRHENVLSDRPVRLRAHGATHRTLSMQNNPSRGCFVSGRLSLTFPPPGGLTQKPNL
jgi:hypothetical protein